jgi:hypothetical protein
MRRKRRGRCSASRVRTQVCCTQRSAARGTQRPARSMEQQRRQHHDQQRSKQSRALREAQATPGATRSDPDQQRPRDEMGTARRDLPHAAAAQQRRPQHQRQPRPTATKTNSGERCKGRKRRTHCAASWPHACRRTADAAQRSASSSTRSGNAGSTSSDPEQQRPSRPRSGTDETERETGRGETLLTRDQDGGRRRAEAAWSLPRELYALKDAPLRCERRGTGAAPQGSRRCAGQRRLGRARPPRARIAREVHVQACSPMCVGPRCGSGMSVGAAVAAAPCGGIVDGRGTGGGGGGKEGGRWRGRRRPTTSADGGSQLPADARGLLPQALHGESRTRPRRHRDRQLAQRRARAQQVRGRRRQAQAQARARRRPARRPW